MNRPPRPLPHCTDDRLRLRGFSIKFRKNNEEPVWERNKVEYKQSEALKVANRELKEQRQ